MSLLQQACPCGSGDTYDACCGLLHRGAGEATTAEELMRSRYAAFAVGDASYLFRTWHPRTRPDDPADLEPDPAVTWTGLEVLATEDGRAQDEAGVVRFAAHRVRAGRAGTMRERSRFVRRAGRWVYVDGDQQ